MINFDLKAYVEQNPDLVVRKQSTRYPDLFVLKYHPKVFFHNLWTPELCELRGLVVDSNWNVVAYPFTKVFNRGERNTDFNADADVYVVEKINGFMAAATMTKKYGLLISTTGSLDSEYADMAREHLKGFRFKENYTYLFEICDERDPHIIPEFTGPYLIGVRDLTTQEMVPQTDLLAIRHQLCPSESDELLLLPRWVCAKFSDVLEDIKHCEIEGYMVIDQKTGETLKLKSPHYLTKKLFARVSSRKLNNNWLKTAHKKLDEEYYPLLEHIRKNKEHFQTLDEQQRLRYMEEFLYEQ